MLNECKTDDKADLENKIKALDFMAGFLAMKMCEVDTDTRQAVLSMIGDMLSEYSAKEVLQHDR